jgi:hypothetical protein
MVLLIKFDTPAPAPAPAARPSLKPPHGGYFNANHTGLKISAILDGFLMPKSNKTLTLYRL